MCFVFLVPQMMEEIWRCVFFVPHIVEESLELIAHVSGQLWQVCMQYIPQECVQNRAPALSFRRKLSKCPSFTRRARVEQIADVPVPRIQEQFLGVVKTFFRSGFIALWSGLWPSQCHRSWIKSWR